MFCKRHQTSGCLLWQSIIHFCSHYVKIFAYLMSKLFHYNQFMWKTVVLSSIILSWTCSLPLSTVFMICNDDFLFYSGPATHHRSVRGSQRWTQPHLTAGGALWRDTGKVMLMWDQIFHPQLYSKPTSKHQFEILLKRLSLITWICSLNISPPPFLCLLLLYRPCRLCLIKVPLAVCIWLDSSTV